MTSHAVVGNRLLAGLAVLVLWVVFLDFPAFSAGPDLDPSWQQALGYFFKHRFQAGVDYVFTYGPLGYFYTRAYDADLFGAKFAWEVGFKLLIAVVIVRAVRTIPQPVLRALFLILIFLLPDHPDVLHPLVIVLLGLAGLGPQQPSQLFLTVGAAALALLALVKFNLSVFALAALLVLCLSLARAGRWHAALLTAACFTLTLLGAWLLTGQELANLPRYLHGAREIAAGYGEAMGIEGEPWQVVHALAVVALLLAAAATCEFRQFRPLVLIGLLGLSLFLEWKHAFVRQGSHVMNFFAFAALLPFVYLSVLPAERSSRRRLVLASGAVLLALVGRFAYDHLALTPLRIVSGRLLRVPDNAWAVLFPAGLRARLEADRNRRQEQWALPRVRAAVGASSIDLISCEQGVLFLNGLHYRPRPVFQS